MLTDLAWCGPDSQSPRWGLDQAFDYCEKLAKNHYENFSVTHGWLPREIRPHFCSIYAYCRWSDDLADELDDPVGSIRLLGWWRGELQKASRGESLHPVFVALHHTMETYSLSIVPFDDLLSAFVQDQSVTSYEDDAQLLDYCRRSANPVGRIILGLARTSSPQTLEWSDSICTGLQIANFCQDVSLDAARGRFYLPKERLDRGRITQSQWAQGSDRAPKVLQEWTEQARMHLSAGAPLAEQGPSWFRRSVRLFVGGGLQILDNIAGNRFDVWSQPVEVTKFQKIRLAVRAVLGTPKSSGSKIRA